MDLTGLRELLYSPVVTTSTAVAVCSFVVGYYLGVGRSLFAYNENSRRKLAAGSAETDEDELETDEEGEDGEMRNKLPQMFEECKMIILLRTDVKMDKGKMAAQACHAALDAYRAAQRYTPEYVSRWERTGQAKVALRCTSEQDLFDAERDAKRFGVASKIICDAGRTQIPAGTRTCIGIGPAPRSLIDRITGAYKLL